ncbi:MAG: tripartite tricarboxylate transporter substrate binding protein [Rhodospirillales bacterium]|nr:tripartite tricarboxylate transporter substrate binding protein [Rhodospirillales bacterium]
MIDRARWPCRRIVRAASAALLALAAVAAAAAEKFPAKPIEVVIHSKYGGGTDTTARMMIVGAKRILGADFTVVAKRGGGGSKAHQYAMSKPRDGHTVLAMTQTHLYTIARGGSPLTIDDVVGVARAMDDPTFVAVAKTSPHKTLATLIEASRTNALNWGIANVGGTEHIGLAQLATAAGIKFKVVPFGSGAQMVQALMSGAIDATLPNVSEGGQQIKDGTMRALAVMAEKRLPEFADVPATFELGYQVKTSTTRGYWVLKGAPPERVEALSKAFVAAMREPAFANYLKGVGLDAGTNVAGHDVWDRQIKEEYAAARETLKSLGLLK